MLPTIEAIFQTSEIMNVSKPMVQMTVKIPGMSDTIIILNSQKEAEDFRKGCTSYQEKYVTVIDHEGVIFYFLKNTTPNAIIIIKNVKF